MSLIIIRMGILLLACLATSAIVWSGKRLVEKQRQQALTALPLATPAVSNVMETADSTANVYILAFSSADCHQCHQLQAPALRRVQETYGSRVSVLEVDAPSEPELTRHYHVLTVPTTVILDAARRPQAVNYGFASAPQLIQQVKKAISLPSNE